MSNSLRYQVEKSISGSAATAAGHLWTDWQDWNDIYAHAHATVLVHRAMLSSVTPAEGDAAPVVFCRLVPVPTAAPDSSSRAQALIAQDRYNQITDQLSSFEQEAIDEGTLDRGAIATATQIVEVLRKQEIAPPELAWVGDEAIAMLWVLESTRYALTVTDKEFGYVVRRDRQTVKRRSNLKVEAFSITHLV